MTENGSESLPFELAEQENVRLRQKPPEASIFLAETNVLLLCKFEWKRFRTVLSHNGAPRLNTPVSTSATAFKTGPCQPVGCGTNGFVDATSNLVARWVFAPKVRRAPELARSLVLVNRLTARVSLNLRKRAGNQGLGAYRQCCTGLVATRIWGERRISGISTVANQSYRSGHAQPEGLHDFQNACEAGALVLGRLIALHLLRLDPKAAR